MILLDALGHPHKGTGYPVYHIVVQGTRRYFFSMLKSFKRNCMKGFLDLFFFTFVCLKVCVNMYSSVSQDSLCLHGPPLNELKCLFTIFCFHTINWSMF